MRPRGKLVLTTVTVCLVGALVGLLAWRMVAKEEGKSLAAAALAGDRPEAPDFTLPLLGEEGTLTLSSLRGRVVVLNFWASWCPPCREEAPVLQRGFERYRDRGVLFVGVDVNDISANALEFLEEYGITYPNVHDGKGSTLGRFGVPGLPETMFLDAQGRIAAYVPRAIDEATLEESIALALGS